ncbi:MAG: CopG family transcriptional regulator [Betaproteobacteria bacterium HGW-Betaproteobacteria-1]|jgi:antitoxin component of RelBE/YafQ-DinJ toxin-antitoxin module|nr:MAG: CopG family transcriptional regulator [Betaproteobacteria bacterium HGW-Betaproteobacteria-1]
MENRTARLTLLIDPTKKQIFEEVCARRDLTPSQVVRQMIRDYVQQYGTEEQLARMPVNLKSEKK